MSNFRKSLTDLYHQHIARSLKSTIIWIFIPIIICLVFSVGIVSYTVAARQIEKNAYLNIKDTVSQTRNHLNDRLKVVFEQLVALQNDTDFLTLLTNLDNRNYKFFTADYISVNRNLDRILSTHHSIIDSILVYFNDGRLMLIKKDYYISKITFSYDEWRAKYNHNQSGFYWQNLHHNDVFKSIEGDSKVASVFRIIGKKDSKIRGIILFHFREDFFKEILQNAQISENGYLALVSNDGMMVFKEVPIEYGPNNLIVQRLLGQKKVSGRFEYGGGLGAGKKMAVIFDTIQINKWKLAAIFPENDIINKASFIKDITLVVILFLILTAMFLSNLVAKIITQPLTLLTEKVKRVEKGDLSIRFEADSSNEIGILNKGIRDLIARVNKLLTQVKEEQELKRQAEFAALQAQINPHFLYNTLDSIQQLCEMGENQAASNMTNSLACFFRISLSGGKEIITVAEELEHVKNYLIIQKMRYEENFDYDFRVDPGILACKIVKLTLQPVVENAIYHGIKEKREKGLIKIAGYREGSVIILEVHDNGVGILGERLKELQRALKDNQVEPMQGFGIRNVHQRLQLHYGLNFGLDIHSEPGKGTTVKVIIPGKRGGNDASTGNH